MFHEFTGPVARRRCDGLASGRTSMTRLGNYLGTIRILPRIGIPLLARWDLQFVWVMELWHWRFIFGVFGGLGAIGGQKLTKWRVK